MFALIVAALEMIYYILFCDSMTYDKFEKDCSLSYV